MSAARVLSTPVALRVLRPYPDEDAFLAAEALAFSSNGVALIGAPQRPFGVVLRFEIVLNHGESVMRGEGRVLGYQTRKGTSEGALMLKFTRLDLSSKELLDRILCYQKLTSEESVVSEKAAPCSYEASEPHTPSLAHVMTESSVPPTKLSSGAEPSNTQTDSPSSKTSRVMKRALQDEKPLVESSQKRSFQEPKASTKQRIDAHCDDGFESDVDLDETELIPPSTPTGRIPTEKRHISLTMFDDEPLTDCTEPIALVSLDIEDEPLEEMVVMTLSRSQRNAALNRLRIRAQKRAVAA